MHTTTARRQYQRAPAMRHICSHGPNTIQKRDLLQNRSATKETHCKRALPCQVRVSKFKKPTIYIKRDPLLRYYKSKETYL